MSKIIIILSLLSGLLFLSVSSVLAEQQKNLTPITVQLNWHHQFQFAGFYAAIKQGYYQDVGLEVTVKKRTENFNPMKALLNGEIEFAVAYNKVIVDYLKGAPIKLVMASFQYSPLVLISNTPIKSLNDLAYKRMAFFDNIQFLTLLDKTPEEVVKTIDLQKTTINLEDFKEGNTDLYSAYRTNEPFQLALENIPYYILDPKSYGVQSYGDLVVTSAEFANKYPEKVQGFKEATIKGWQYAINNQEEMVDYILDNYPLVKSRQALLAEAFETTHYVQDGNVSIGSVTDYRLQAIVSNAMKIGMLSEGQQNQPLKDFIFKPNFISFTEEERQYLASKPIVKLANRSDRKPCEFIDESGEYKGIIADYLALITQKTGLEFKALVDIPWDRVVEKIKTGELDLSFCPIKPFEKSHYMNFTEPFLHFPMVLVSKVGASYVYDINVFNGKVVAVMNDSFPEKILRRNYPEIKLLFVNNATAGVSAVSQGVAVAYVGNIAVINQIIRDQGFNDLSIVGKLEHQFGLSMGVQKSNPILFSIIEKSLASITVEQKQKIFEKWFSFTVVTQVDNSLIKKTIVWSSVIVVLLLLIAIFFRYQKRVRQKYIDQIHELTFATLTDMKKRRIIWASDSFAKLSGYSKTELYADNYVKTLGILQTKEKIIEIEQALAQKGVWVGALQGKKKNGQSYWVEVTYRLYRKYFFSPVQVWETRVDITSKVMNEKFAVSDELTGLYNRRHFNQVVSQKLNEAVHDRRYICVLLVDIDWFKSINDSFGHKRGDDVLIQVASEIKKFFYLEEEFVFRMGGEEFFVYCSSDSAKSFLARSKALLKAVRALKIPSGKEGVEYLTVSIGAVFGSYDKKIAREEIFSIVDANLYQAKHNGRNQVVFTELDLRI